MNKDDCWLACNVRATVPDKGHSQLHPHFQRSLTIAPSPFIFSRLFFSRLFFAAFVCRDFLFSLRYSLLFETVISGDSFIILLRTQRGP